MEDAQRQWDDYCDRLAAQLAPPPPASGPATPSVFGCCRRCRSARLMVTTRQVRRADEGATEFRVCQACGYTSRHNS